MTDEKYVQKLESALDRIINLTDYEMEDGDGAREIAENARRGGVNKPAFLGEPDTPSVLRGATWVQVHEYYPPSDGSQLVEALLWMLSVYDNVQLHWGESNGSGVCSLYGRPRAGKIH